MLLGLPPFAMFASELGIARALADERLAWVLAAGMVLIARRLRRAGAQFGPHAARRRSGAAAPAIAVPATVAAALLVGVAASIALGVTAGPLTDLFGTAANQLGALP